MSTPKKLLYIITKSNFGGAQRYVFELACASQAAGYDVAVAAGGRGELMDRLAKKSIRTFEIVGAQRDISWKHELQTLRSVHTILADFVPDIVHLNSSKIGLLGSLMARIRRVPQIVFTAHGWPFREPRSRTWRLMAWLGSYLTSIFSHHVIVVCHHDAQGTYLIGTTHKQTVIHNALFPYALISRNDARAALFTPDTVQKHGHDVWLVTHGEINHNKNHSIAIDAVAEFNSTHPSKIFYTIIGAGELVPTLKEQVGFRGMHDFITFIDHVVDVRSYLLAFDLYVLPSHKEGLPYAVLEAGYAELPIIASNIGGVPEIVRHGYGGILIDPKTHTGIVAALALLINEPEKRSAYSAYLKAHIDTEFSPEAMLTATHKIYASGSK